MRTLLIIIGIVLAVATVDNILITTLGVLMVGLGVIGENYERV